MTVGTDSERQGLAERPWGATPRKPGVPPRQQKLRPLLREQADALQQPDDLVPEQQLGRGLVDEGDRNPPSPSRPAPARHQRVHVRVPVCKIACGLNDCDHSRPDPLVAGRRARQLEHRLPRRQRQPAEQSIRMGTDQNTYLSPSWISRGARVAVHVPNLGFPTGLALSTELTS